jgi:hypothetical protein
VSEIKAKSVAAGARRPMGSQEVTPSLTPGVSDSQAPSAVMVGELDAVSYCSFRQTAKAGGKLGQISSA